MCLGQEVIRAMEEKEGVKGGGERGRGREEEDKEGVKGRGGEG